MKRYFLVILLLFSTLPAARAQYFDYDLDEEEANRQYVSWGYAGGPWLAAYRIHLPDHLGGDSLQALPSLGLGGDVFLDYHISDRWRVRLTTGLVLDRARLKGPSSARTLTTFGIDVMLPLIYRFDVGRGTLLAMLGPYSRFVVGSHITGGGTSPFELQVATDPATGEPRFALDSWLSGLALGLGYETRRGLSVALDVRIGMTDMLNAVGAEGYVLPYAVGISVGHHFQ